MRGEQRLLPPHRSLTTIVMMNQLKMAVNNGNGWEIMITKRDGFVKLKNELNCENQQPE